MFCKELCIIALVVADLISGQIYVKPNGSPDAVCPEEPCLTLNQFADYSNSSSRPNYLVFLPGNHSLAIIYLVADASDVRLRGISNDFLPPRIIIEQNASITFANVSSLQIEKLTFILCKNQCQYNTSLFLKDCHNVTISNSFFLGSRNESLLGAGAIGSYKSFFAVINCSFEDIITELCGAIHAVRQDIVTISGSTFYRNRATFGASAVCASGQATIIWEGTPKNRFLYNTHFNSSYKFQPGPLYCDHCRLEFTGENVFKHNGKLYSSAGGAIFVYGGTLLFVSGRAEFYLNKATFGGAILVVGNSKMFCMKNASILILGNQAEAGGGIAVRNSSLEISENVIVNNNFARETGGGFSITCSSTCKILLSGTLENNYVLAGQSSAADIMSSSDVVIRDAVFKNGNTLAIIHSTNVTFSNTRFINNSAIRVVNSTLNFIDYNLFSKNAHSFAGGAIFSKQTSIFFKGVTKFKNNSAIVGGALYGADTIIYIEQMVEFSHNSAKKKGGAIYLQGKSQIVMTPHSHFNSSFNTAALDGGGIFYEDSIEKNQCSYENDRLHLQEFPCLIKFKFSLFPHDYTLLNRSDYCKNCTKLGLPAYCIDRCLIFESAETRLKTISITSYFDSAKRSGDFLYGGLLDKCQIFYANNGTHKTMYQFLMDTNIIKITTKNSLTKAVTSDTYALCFCDHLNGNQDCTHTKHITILRGQKFAVPLMAAAQGNSAASTNVTAITSPSASLTLFQNYQHLPRSCSNLTYALYSTQDFEEIKLYPEGPCRDVGLARATLNVTLLPCPAGFALTPDGHCDCGDRLERFNVSCNIDTDISTTKAAGLPFWVGVMCANDSYEGLILYDKCPVEYCRADEVNLTICCGGDLDMQCVDGRTGVLCGGCAENHSLTLGSSKCTECSNSYLALTVLFAFAGFLLVAVLSVLRLTVATGMLNSLILYANIVQANKRFFFPANTVNVLTVFVAWMNLDLGFGVCYFDGMDEFAQTCLQFAFPVYVWVVMSVIILTSRYSITVSKLIGHNPIAVLATLLLMSYAKILKIVIEVYASVELEYPKNVTRRVWLKDANVPYLQSRHLALTVVTSLVLVLVFLPYTFFLLLGHRLYRYSGTKCLRLVNRFKPLLDSYYAPYKPHTRWWTGLLLLARCLLYVVFSFNSLGGIRKSLLAITLTFTALGFAVGLIPGNIYEKQVANVLEVAVYLNLIILSATLPVFNNTPPLAYSLIGAVFAIMVGVVIYHLHVHYLATTALWLKIKVKLFHLSKITKNPSTKPDVPQNIVTKTFVELREPLLDS